jgi:lysophospholipid acyltransferase (LPLAT)-like uncharacterized protein
MKLRHPWLIRCLAFAGALVFRWWTGTLRRRFHFAGDRPHPADPRAARCLYAFWHEAIFFGAGMKARIHVLISRHADGEFIARMARHLGYGVVRGSSTQGGGPAVRALAAWARRTHVGVTPDGPRGPRRRVQPGVVYLASRTGLPVVAFGVGWSRAWRARSWDRFAVPCPYSTVYCVVAPEVRVPADLGRGELERYRRLVEERLHWATETAERWAAGVKLESRSGCDDYRKMCA